MSLKKLFFVEPQRTHNGLDQLRYKIRDHLYHLIKLWELRLLGALKNPFSVKIYLNILK